jgi:glycerophosphoryl diester phosphodiesterase
MTRADGTGPLVTRPGRPGTRITGHRGGRALWPENSLEGFGHVSSLGVDAVEFDVHLTDHGELLVVHDARLERTTDGAGPVRALSPRDRPLLRLQGCDETIPTLGQVLDILAREEGPALHVELKNDETGRPYPGLIEKVLTQIDGRGLRHRCHLASFDVTVLESCRRLAPDVPRLVSVDATWADRQEGLARFLERVDDLADIVAIHKSLLREQWEVVTGRIPAERLCVWTVNDPDQIRAWFDRDIGHLTSDRPDLALEIRDQQA